MSGSPGAVAVRLEAHGLSHRYGRRSVLEGLSFRLEAPGVVAVRGPNGAGKTTLLRILAGLLRPGGGATQLMVDGHEVPVAARGRWVGYAGPELAFYPELTAAENLRFAAEARGVARAAEPVDAALAVVGLESRRSDRVGALSSGMVQRLRLAFALLHQPPVLLLDEPSSHLDDAGRATLSEVIGRARDGRLVVIATNEEREVALADERIELVGRGLGDPA